jgi:4-methylaminobutanoate oxidase (formaldehyde-forming)
VESADVVVVGGGIIGAACALHLLEAGISRVLLVERLPGFGQGTSAALAGNIDHWAAGYMPKFGPEELELERYGFAFYQELADSAESFDLTLTGCVYLATTEDGWKTHIQPFLDFADVVDTIPLTSEEVETATRSLVSADAVVGGVFHRAGGWLSVEKTTQVMVRHFVEKGGRALAGCPVESILISKGRVAGVDTPRGVISSREVVVAAGAWTNLLLRTAGVWLPMVPVVSGRIISAPSPIQADAPVILIKELGFYARHADGELMWGCGFHVAPRHSFVDEDPPHMLDNLPLDGGAEMLAHAVTFSAVVPSLTQMRRFSLAYGLPCHTPDKHAIIGPVPGTAGLWVAAGCNEAAAAHAPGFGKLVADMLVAGNSGITSTPFQPSRFAATSQRMSGADILTLASS